MEQGTAQYKPGSVWWREQPPEELQQNPHQSCGDDEPHAAHGWRGTRREFRGAVEVTRTLWCEGAPGE